MVDQHFVVVDFDVEAGKQEEALALIGDYVASFLSQQPGFIHSVLHRGLDGSSIVHYAQWRSEQDFKQAGEKARAHPDLPALLAYNPRGRGFTSWRTFGE
jgi:heme-degrading monooxygenase HmoA